MAFGVTAPLACVMISSIYILFDLLEIIICIFTTYHISNLNKMYFVLWNLLNDILKTRCNAINDKKKKCTNLIDNICPMHSYLD